jgi:hypothetical protein
MDSYYYDKKNSIIYRVSNLPPSKFNPSNEPLFKIDNDPHIIELNQLPLPKNKKVFDLNLYLK